jgi:phosphotransferase family enzyme
VAFAGKRQHHQIGAGHLQRLPGDELPYFVNFSAAGSRRVAATLTCSTAAADGPPRTAVITEVLTYIHGQAAVPPLPMSTLTDTALISVAALVRSYHRAVQSFDPAGYRWPRPIPVAFRTGLVSHNDVHPANLVFRDGPAVALIDFDLAGPGSAAWDLAAAARNWVPLQDDQDITDCRQGRTIERFRTFIDASELTRAERRHVAEAVVANHDWTYAIVTEVATAGHQGFADYWHKVMEPTARARRWCLRHQRDLLAAARRNMS